MGEEFKFEDDHITKPEEEKEEDNSFMFTGYYGGFSK